MSETEGVVQLQEAFVLQFLHHLHLLPHVVLVLWTGSQDEFGGELSPSLSFPTSLHLPELSPACRKASINIPSKKNGANMVSAVSAWCSAYMN